MYKHIIWDFDGTLFDSYPIMTRAFKEVINEAGIIMDSEKISELMKISMSHLIEYCKSNYQLNEQLLTSYSKRRKELELEYMKPFQGVQEVCKSLYLNNKHNYLYTHRGNSAIEFLHKYGMYEYFSGFVTKESNFKRKPDPEAIMYLTKEFNMIKTEALMIGDRDIDLLAAKNAEIDACFYKGSSEQDCNFADYIITDFKELKDIVDKKEIMDKKEIIEINKKYWNQHADLWFGATALPTYGVKFTSENELNLFGEVSGKKMLEICCGSGHSLKYHADRNASELWGVDISSEQLKNAESYLAENGYSANFICSPMEADLDIPSEYFDYVYSIYGIGWTTDLDGTFNKIASYLKKNGIFIFSWHHTLNYCVSWSREEHSENLVDDKLTFKKSYFDESYFEMPVDESNIIICNRKMSTYINALAKAGFVIEQFVEESDSETMKSCGDLSDKTRKAQIVPLSFVIKARKL